MISHVLSIGSQEQGKNVFLKYVTFVNSEPVTLTDYGDICYIAHHTTPVHPS